jgi:glycosyltransferase involved in cell wall biosynthesis
MADVSIILPTFNRVQYLRPAIDSVLAQTFVDWELIIADDGSAGETRSYLQAITDRRVRTMWRTHCGNPSMVRNAAIRVAAAPYVAFIDSDDTWHAQMLERQISVLRCQPGRRWIYTHCNRIDEEGRPIRDELLRRQVLPEGWIFESLLTNLKNQMAMSSVMIERAFFDEVGGFDDDQRWCEDQDLFLRLALRSPVALIAEPMCSIRAHREHYSGNRIAEYVSRVRLYGKLADSMTDRRLRLLCQRAGAEQTLVLAGLWFDKGDHHATWRTLKDASEYSWRFPRWWFGALKALARPLAPARLLRAYRKRYGSEA